MPDRNAGDDESQKQEQPGHEHAPASVPMRQVCEGTGYLVGPRSDSWDIGRVYGPTAGLAPLTPRPVRLVGRSHQPLQRRGTEIRHQRDRP